MRIKNHDVSVVLADQFVRYALLPWNAALKTEAQWLALARHRLTTVHGAAAADWEVKLTETAPQGARLACAVDRELIAGAASEVRRRRRRARLGAALLVAGFNRHPQHLGSGSCWLVIEEPGRLTLAFIQRGIWVAIRSRRIDEPLARRAARDHRARKRVPRLSEPCTRVIVCAQGAFDTEMHEAFRTQAVSYKELALAWDIAMKKLDIDFVGRGARSAWAARVLLAVAVAMPRHGAVVPGLRDLARAEPAQSRQGAAARGTGTQRRPRGSRGGARDREAPLDALGQALRRARVRGQRPGRAARDRARPARRAR